MVPSGAFLEQDIRLNLLLHEGEGRWAEEIPPYD